MPSDNQNIDQTSFVATDFRAIFHALIERSWLIMLCVAAGGLLSWSIAIRSPKIYQARSVLEVAQSVQNVANIQSNRPEDLRLPDMVKTIEQKLQMRSLLEMVVNRLGLTTNSHFMVQGKPGDPEKIANSLLGMLNVQLRRGSRLIDINVQHTDPELTQKVANELVDAFLLYNNNKNLQLTKSNSQDLEKLVEASKQKLKQAELALQDYKEKYKSVSLLENQDIVSDKRKELNARVTEASTRRLQLEADVEQIKILGDDIEKLQTIPSISQDQNVGNFRKAVVDQEALLARLKERYKPAFPVYKQAVSELTERKKTLNDEILKARNRSVAMLDTARTTENRLKEALADEEKAALELEKQRIGYEELNREVSSNRALYESLLKSLTETDATKDLVSNKVSLSDRAYLPERPIKPNVKQMFLMGLAGGLALGVLLSLGLNALDSSLKTVDQAENFLEMPVLGAIPNIGKDLIGTAQLITIETSNSPAAEAFRTLRTSLSFLGKDEDRRVFLFTSSIPSEGKTFCSLNYAASLAQQGFKTVLIDADLRKPAVERILVKTDKRRIGVTDYLTGKKTVLEVVCPTELEGFHIIPAGTTAPHPAELLSKTNFSELVRDALLHYDRVVIDSAPIHAVSDTLMLVKHVQTVCLVVHSRMTPRRAVARSIHLLRAAHAPLAGAIMNRLPKGRGSYYYDSYYSYSYYGNYSEKGVYGAKS